MEQRKKGRHENAYDAFDVAYEWNLDTKRIEWYGDIADKLGYTQDELPVCIHRWRKLIHPDDRQELPPRSAHTETNQYYNVYRIRHKSGRFVQVQDYGTVIPDESGHALKCVGLIGF